MQQYEQRINRAREALGNAECVLIGGGAGLSAAAGLIYSGKRFTDNFADFIEKYGVTDMYTASFYPFKTQAERWAHWARHIHVNRFAPPTLPLYGQLHELVKDTRHFALTTNVDGQFEKAGFQNDSSFAAQGDYAYLQCDKGCHSTLYDDEQLVQEMLRTTVDCFIPTELVPKCPVCGGDMDVNLRHNEFFVEDAAWHEACARYEAFLRETKKSRIVFLEIGVGYNTPGIIRYPFEQMTYQNEHATLIRVNRDHPMAMKENEARTISFDEDVSMVVTDLLTVKKDETNE